MAPSVTGLVLIRAWREETAEISLRVEIRVARDVADGFDRSLAFADVDAALAVVRTWLVDVRDGD